ncbi:MAG: flavin reductase family protein [Beutenbergiaceae bacterium]
MHIAAQDFKHAFRNHPVGVAVVTADVGQGPVAMTVSSLSSVCLDPPTLTFSASAISSATPTIRQAGTLVVHLVASDRVDLAELGAKSGIDRFADDIDWSRLPTGEPYYPNANAWLRCQVVDRLDVHGSWLIIAEAIGAKPHGNGSDPQPLVYHNRNWFSLGDKAVLRPTQLPFHVVWRGED